MKPKTTVTKAEQASLKSTMEEYFTSLLYDRTTREEFASAIEQLLKQERFKAMLDEKPYELLDEGVQKWSELTTAGADVEAAALVMELLSELKRIGYPVTQEEGLQKLLRNFELHRATDRYAQELAALIISL